MKTGTEELIADLNKCITLLTSFQQCEEIDSCILKIKECIDFFKPNNHNHCNLKYSFTIGRTQDGMSVFGSYLFMNIADIIENIEGIKCIDKNQKKPVIKLLKKIYKYLTTNTIIGCAEVRSDWQIKINKTILIDRNIED